ncbi:hypothetical protein ACHAPT_010513 [Fusarium lateritium]
MKSAVILSIFGLLLTPAAAVSIPRDAEDGADAIVNTFDDFSGLLSEAKPIVDNIDFDNAQPTAETIRDKLNEMLKLNIVLVNKFHKPKSLKEDKQREVCTKFDQFTPEFLGFLLNLNTVAVGIDAKSEGVTKRVLYVMEQFFVGFDLLRAGPLRTLLPVCKNKVEDNANKILEDLKVLIRAYGGTTDCSRPGGPLVNLRKTCPGGGRNEWDFPGGFIPSSGSR